MILLFSSKENRIKNRLYICHKTVVFQFKTHAGKTSGPNVISNKYSILIG